MKSKIKYIACFAMVVITICISAIQTFALGVDFDGYEVKTTMIPYTDIYIQNKTLAIDNIEGENINKWDIITYQAQELPPTESTIQTVNRHASETIINNLTTNNGGFRNLQGLQNVKIYVGSNEWYTSHLYLYNPTTIGWTDIIIYDLPEMYYIPSDTATPEKITELRFKVSEIRSGDNGEYVDFRLGLATEKRTYATMINTETGYLRDQNSKILIKYTEQDYEQFLSQYFPIPQQAYNPAVDNNNAIANVYKNNITFSVIGFATPNNLNYYQYWTTTRTKVKYIWERLNGIGDILLSSDFGTRQTGRYKIYAEPFVITDKQDFEELINTAPKLSANLSATTMYITYNWSLLASSENITNIENDEGAIETKMTEKGLYWISGFGSETITNGSLFLTEIPNIEYTFHWYGSGETTTYRYENTPQPILIENMVVNIDVDWSKVSNEADYKYQLRISQNYYNTDNITYIRTRDIDNYFARNNNVGEYANNNALGFTVFRDEMNPPEPEPWNLFDFFNGTLSVFSIPIFGAFSISTILLVVIAIGVIFAVLKYFAGG